MPRENKNWGGRLYIRNNNYRTIVRAPSKNALSKILHVGYAEVKNYWGVTHSEEEIAALDAHPPGTVLWCERPFANSANDYKVLPTDFFR